ncbi:hypothetical protein L6R50_27955 [Myxococcota bacterium]|nr:hypothetical protein [Myxococcota bacterium]
MAAFKQMVVLVLAGAVLGQVLISLSAPSLLGFASDPSGTGALCNCTELTQAVIRRVLTAQAIAAAAGGLLALVAGVLAVRRARTKAKPPVPGRGDEVRAPRTSR